MEASPEMLKWVLGGVVSIICVLAGVVSLLYRQELENRKLDAIEMREIKLKLDAMTTELLTITRQVGVLEGQVLELRRANDR